MSAEPMVSQRLFDETCKRYDDQIAQLRRAHARLADERDEDVKTAVALAVAAAFKEHGKERNTSWVTRIAMVGAGAGVVAAWVALTELLRSSSR